MGATRRWRRRLFSAIGLLALLIATSLSAGLPVASAASRTARTPVDPVYTIALTGSADGRTWTGTQQIQFKNASSMTLTKVWLRLWSNGFYDCDPQPIVVTSVTGGFAGAPSVSCSALPVTLDQALAPGATATIGMNVSISVPPRQDRFGYYEGAALLGSALPTLAIHDGDGWNLDPYSDMGESYYSVAGTYNLSLTAPTALKIASTGQVVSDTDNGNGTRTQTILATNVRDFEWAAAAFKQLTATANSGTTIRVWYVPGYVAKSTAEGSLAAALDAMNTFSTAFGKYPYPEVDVVLSWIGYGMEYPQITFTIPDRVYVIHELAHQWWYGIVGNDQYDSPWLDESFASWSETLPDFPYSCDGPFSWPSAGTRITKSMTYWTNHPDDYWVIYGQGACALADAASHLGMTHFIATLRTYANGHWFGVATTADFKSAIKAAAAKWAPTWNVEAYFKKWRIGAG